jgi:hypothetical protein
MKFAILLSIGLMTASVHLEAAESDKPKPETYLTIETAGPDFAAQGEYVNDWGGAQVIALGEDKFRLVTYKGGLPGAGWDQQTRTEMEGKRDGRKIVFSGQEGYKVELAAGKINITTDNGGPWTMNKTSRTSPTLGAKPPAAAIVLFDGKDADEWNDGKLDDRGLLAAGTTSKKEFQDFTLHVEFLLPFKPLGRGQDRGNSGVYLQDRYEVQVLDSFGLKGENNECGGIYGKAKPKVNMCFPPLAWQTYDIDYQAAKFDDAGKKLKSAILTVKHNGITIHENFEVAGGTTASGRPEGPAPGPIQLQGHGNPVFYRNLWLLQK